MIVVKHKHPKNGTEEAGLPACPGFLRSQIKGLLGNILFGATMPLHRPPPVTLTFGALREQSFDPHLQTFHKGNGDSQTNEKYNQNGERRREMAEQQARAKARNDQLEEQERENFVMAPIL